MLFTWFELVLTVGVVQGIVTSFLLLKESKHSTSNLLLAAVLLCFSLVCIKIVINSIGLGKAHQTLTYLPLAFETAIPPLAYFYCIALTQPNFELNRQKTLHFLPFSLFMAYAIFIYFNLLSITSTQDKQSFLSFYQHALIKGLEDYFTVFSIFIYLTLGSMKLNQFRKQANAFTSDNGHAIFTWLKRIQVLLVVLLVLLVSNMLLSRLVFTYSDFHFGWKLYFIYLAAIIYYLGFKAYRSPVFQIANDSVPELSVKPQDQITESKARELADQINNIIDKKHLYLNPTFSILELSQLMQVNPSTLSKVINRQLGSNFRNLINQKRIEAAKQLLLKNREKGVSIIAQALACGFNSEASFYRIFKKHTGLSPSQYIKSSNSAK